MRRRAKSANRKSWRIVLILNLVVRAAALSFCFANAAQAAGGGNRTDSWGAAEATASTTGQSEPVAGVVKRQLIRASWYGGGERLASHTSTGELFRPMGRTAAHRTLPFGTMVKVTSAATGRSTIVRINDRGPAAASGRSLDLSRGAAVDLGMLGSGEARVFMEVMQ